MTREHPAAGAGPACARQGERVELAFAGMRANIRRDLRHARLSRTDLGRGGTHVPAFGIITDGLPEDQPSQVKRRSDVGRGDRQHDDHPDVIAATADLGVDTRAYNRRAFLLGKAAAEITADGSPRREATGPRYVQAHRVPVAGRVIVQVVEAAAWLDRWLPSLLGQVKSALRCCERSMHADVAHQSGVPARRVVHALHRGDKVALIGGRCGASHHVVTPTGG